MNCNKINQFDMQQNHSETNTEAVLSNILELVDAQIKKKRLLQELPTFLLFGVGKIIGQSMVSVIPNADIRGLALKEEDIDSIPKLEKDTLMPKDLSEEKVRAPSPDRLSPRSSCSSLKKSIKFPRRVSSRQDDKMKSISLHGISDKKQNSREVFSKLQQENNESDEELGIGSMRERTEVRMKYLQDQQQLRKKKEKHFQEKLNQFNETMDGHREEDVTFDYEGDPMRATIKEDKLKLNMMRTGMGMPSRKLKEGFSKINAQSFKIEAGKKQKQREDNFRSIKQVDMPMFPMKAADQYNVKNLKLEEYRKHFGKRYSRMGLNTTTIPVERAKTSRDDLFAEKKHFKQARATVQTQGQVSEMNTRRLALPKLHGKYKVLDRYEEK